MPLVASHSDALRQAKHTRAHAALQSRALFIVSLLAKEITSGALNQINKLRGVSTLIYFRGADLLHLRIFSALQQKGNTLSIREGERDTEESRDYTFFSYCGFLWFHREQIPCCENVPPLSSFPPSRRALRWTARGRGGGEVVPRRGVLRYGC